MSFIETTIVIALLISALYALLSVGFTMIFGVGGVLNVAHAAFLTLGAYLMLYGIQLFGLGPWTATLFSLALVGLFSVLVYAGPVKLIEDDPIIVVIVTLLIFLIVEEFIFVIEGTSPKSLPVLVAGRVTISSTTIQSNQVFMFFLSWLTIIALLVFVNRTTLGKAIQAVSMTKRGATLVGINQFRISTTTWLIAGVLAGLGGIFLGTFQTAVYNMGLGPLIIAFSVVILGGLGSIKGSIIAAHIIGFLETLTTSLVSPRLTGLAPLLLLVIVLVVKPNGLFGREELE
ncbi:branched-chain amino acid ABC transporter permease [Haladaptatus sp. ZSTT2]|uniref:branched-chain amino acid ABC transporter permease n=1 Tax=Haladaptatus sp. ZSTT2 TaxID=3120515 RepID=UPI00300F3409